MALPGLMASVLSYAKFYRSIGWSVFPILPHSKKPAVGAWLPYQSRLATLQELDDWFKDSDKGIAIVTGAISGDLLVLDCDPRHGGHESLANYPPCSTDCPTVKTGGGGFHFYYHAPSKCIPAIAPGLDVKAEGGYVVAPPSIHPDSGLAYNWMPDLNPHKCMIPSPPDWLIKLLVTYKTDTKLTANDKGWVSKALSGVENGNRDNTCIKLAGYFRNILPQDVTLSIMEMWAQRCRPEFDHNEVLKTIHSAYNYEPPTPKGAVPL
ncbi:MAG: bifunctional DNA primase/polymerase [Dehalococcoidia bacterium]|nr:bifunctional DNA primase/polymerase [Dehalococcoidia bacterium]